jgi:ATP-dependent Zn protease
MYTNTIGGHALVALRTEGADPVHKATIMPRGQSLGMVMQLPEGDQTSMSKRQVQLMFMKHFQSSVCLMQYDHFRMYTY